MRCSSLATAALVLATVFSAMACGHAQTSGAASAPLAPPPGFVPPYEIMRTARAAGFDPLAPPLREGTTYVLRATDFRGILMRVVIDARTGAIRDANRIVPGPGSDAQLGMMPPYEAVPEDPVPPYGPSPYGPPPYGAPAGFDEPEMVPFDQSALPRSAPPRSANRAVGVNLVPLPRPRPAELAAGSATSAPAVGGQPPPVTQPQAASAANEAAETKPDATKLDPRNAEAKSGSKPSTPPVPLDKPAPLPAVND